MATTSKNLQAWIRRNIYAVRKGERCTLFVLKHQGVSGRSGQEVHTIEEPKAADDAIAEYCEELEQAAMNDAQGFGGVQTYTVHAYFGQSDKSAGRFTIRAVGETDDDDAESSEPANAKGLVAQAMRHQEMVMRTHALAMNGLVQNLTTLSARQSQQIESLLEERFRAMQTLEEANSRKHEREMEMMREVNRAEQIREGIDKVGALVPFVANKLAGKKLLPEKDPNAMAIQQLLGSLTPEQGEALKGVLTQEQQLILLGLYRQTQGAAPRKRGGKS